MMTPTTTATNAMGNRLAANQPPIPVWRGGASASAAFTGSDLSNGGPPAGPAVGGKQAVERGPGIECVSVQDGPAGARDVQERQLAGKERFDGRLVGGVEHRPAGAAAAATS